MTTSTLELKKSFIYEAKVALLSTATKFPIKKNDWFLQSTALFCFHEQASKPVELTKNKLAYSQMYTIKKKQEATVKNKYAAQTVNGTTNQIPMPFEQCRLEKDRRTLLAAIDF